MVEIVYRPKDAMTQINIRFECKASREPLGEITMPSDSTVGELCRLIRDGPALPLDSPLRLFTQWWIKAKYLPAEIASPSSDTFELLAQTDISSIGIEDESTIQLLASPLPLVAGAIATEPTLLAAAISASRREERRSEALLRAMGSQQQQIGALLVALGNQNDRLLEAMSSDRARQHEEQMDVLKAIQEQGREQGNAIGLALVSINETLKQVSTQLADPSSDRGARSVSHDADAQAAKQWLMTAVTPCGPSIYSISYSDGFTTIEGHETFFALPEAEKKRRPFRFPYAKVGIGSRCLIEFSHKNTIGSGKGGGGLNIGFAAADLAAHFSLNTGFISEPSAYILAVYGTRLWNAGKSIGELPKIADIQPKRKIAMLLDLSHTSSNCLRIFWSDDGTDEKMQLRHDEKFPVRPGEYVPVGCLLDKCAVTFHRILLGDAVPRHYLAHGAHSIPNKIKKSVTYMSSMPSIRSPQKARADVWAMRWAALEEEAEMLRGRTNRLKGSTEVLELEQHINELRGVSTQYKLLANQQNTNDTAIASPTQIADSVDKEAAVPPGQLPPAPPAKHGLQRPPEIFYCKPEAVERLTTLSQQYLKEALLVRARLPALAVAAASTIHEKLEMEVAKGIGYAASAGMMLPSLTNAAGGGNSGRPRHSFGGDSFVKEVSKYTDAQRIELIDVCRSAIKSHIEAANDLEMEWASVDQLDNAQVEQAATVLKNAATAVVVPTRAAAVRALIPSAFRDHNYGTVEELMSMMEAAEGVLWRGKNAAAREDAMRSNDEAKEELDLLEHYEELAAQNPILVSPTRTIDPIDQRLTLNPRPDPKVTNLLSLKEKLLALEAEEKGATSNTDSTEVVVAQPFEVLPSDIRRQLVEAHQLQMQLEFRPHEPKLFEHEPQVVAKDPFVIGDEAFLPSKAASDPTEAEGERNQLVLFSDSEDAFSPTAGAASLLISPSSPTSPTSPKSAVVHLDDSAKTFLQKFGPTLFSRTKVDVALPPLSATSVTGYDRKDSLIAQSGAAKVLSTRNATELFRGPISLQNKKVAALQSYGIESTLVPCGEYVLGHLNPKENATLLPIAQSFDRSSRLDRRTNYWLASSAPSVIAGIVYEDGPQHYMYTTQPRHVYLHDWSVSTRPITVKQFLAVTRDTRLRAEMERVMLALQPALLDVDIKTAFTPIVSEYGALAGFIEETARRVSHKHSRVDDTIEVPFYVAEAFSRALGGVVCPPDVWEAMATGVGGDQQHFVVPNLDDVPSALGLHQLQWEVGVDKGSRGVRGSSWRVAEIDYLNSLTGQFGHELIGRCGGEWNQSITVSSKPLTAAEREAEQGTNINLREHFARLRDAAKPKPTPAAILDGSLIMKDATLVPYADASALTKYTRRGDADCVEALKGFSTSVQEKVIASGLPPPAYADWRPPHCSGGGTHILRSGTDHMTQTIFDGKVSSITTFQGPDHHEVALPAPSPKYYDNLHGFVGPNFHTYSLPHKGCAVAAFRIAIPSCGAGAAILSEGLKSYDTRCGRGIAYPDLLRALGRPKDVIAGIDRPMSEVGSSYSSSLRRPATRGGSSTLSNAAGRIGFIESDEARVVLDGDGWLGGIEPDLVMPAGPDEDAEYSDTHRWVLAAAGLDLCFANKYPNKLRKVVLFGPHKGIRRPPVIEHWMCSASIRGTCHKKHEGDQQAVVAGAVVPMPFGTSAEGINVRTDSLQGLAYTLPLCGKALVAVDTAIRKAHTEARRLDRERLAAIEAKGESGAEAVLMTSWLTIVEDSSYRLVYTDRVTVRPENDPKHLLPDIVLKVEVTWAKRYDVTGGGVPIVSEVAMALAL